MHGDNVAGCLAPAPRLRLRLFATPLGVANPVWLDDPEFDIERHVTRVKTAEPVSRGGLEQIVAGLMANPLNRAHPLWHLDVIERLENDSMALVWRVHHCLADGTTCVRLASAVLWGETADEPPPTSVSWRPRAEPGPVALLALGLMDRAGQAPWCIASRPAL